MTYPIYRVTNGQRVPDRELYGPPVFTGPEFLHLLRWINTQPGFVVWEHTHFGGVRPAAHTARSWHNLKDGEGIGLGADINYFPASAEADQLRKIIIPKLNALGIGWQFADKGHVPNHADHLHLDVGPIGRRGGPAPLYGLFHAKHKADPRKLLTLGPTKEPRKILTYRGMTGARVEVVQRCCYMAEADIDRKFGPLTERAVMNQQRRLGVTIDGRWGPITARRWLEEYGVVKEGMSGPAVMLVQYAVNMPVNQLDRKFGPKTREAVKAAQRWAAITADGVFGAQSRAKIIR